MHTCICLLFFKLFNLSTHMYSIFLCFVLNLIQNSTFRIGTLADLSLSRESRELADLIASTVTRR